MTTLLEEYLGTLDYFAELRTQWAEHRDAGVQHGSMKLRIGVEKTVDTRVGIVCGRLNVTLPGTS